LLPKTPKPHGPKRNKIINEQLTVKSLLPTKQRNECKASIK